jgi:hypothetical protein
LANHHGLAARVEEHIDPRGDQQHPRKAKQAPPPDPPSNPAEENEGQHHAASYQQANVGTRRKYADEKHNQTDSFVLGSSRCSTESPGTYPPMVTSCINLFILLFLPPSALCWSDYTGNLWALLACL